MNQDQALATMKETINRLVAPSVGYAFPLDVAEENLSRARARMKAAFLSASEPGKLLACSEASIAKCVYLSAVTGLYPGAAEQKPDVWLIPRGGELCWQMGKSSYIRLARRAGWDIEATVYYEGEHFELELGTDPIIRHSINLDVERTWETIRGGYAVLTHLESGRIKLNHLTKDQIAARRACAQTKKVWVAWPEEMAIKSILNDCGQRELFPLDAGTREAIAADNAAETDPAKLEAVTVDVKREGDPPKGLAAVALALEPGNGQSETVEPPRATHSDWLEFEAKRIDKKWNPATLAELAEKDGYIPKGGALTVLDKEGAEAVLGLVKLEAEMS